MRKAPKKRVHYKVLKTRPAKVQKVRKARPPQVRLSKKGLRPLSPTQTELTAEWFVTPETLPPTAEELDNIVSFGRLVLEQDAAICEVNQRGLASGRHERGVLMPEEYEIARFHDWVRAQSR